MQGQEEKQVERRAFLRLGCGGRASFDGSYARFWAVCKNISMGGAAVFTDANVRAAELLDLRIDLGEYGEVQALGKVLRSRGGMLGIQFLVLSPSSRFAIAAFTTGRPAHRVLH